MGMFKLINNSIRKLFRAKRINRAKHHSEQQHHRRRCLLTATKLTSTNSLFRASIKYKHYRPHSSNQIVHSYSRVTSKSNNSTYTFEQMFNDNSVVYANNKLGANLSMSQTFNNSTGSSSSSSSASSPYVAESEISAVESERHHFLQSVSIYKLDEEIKLKFFYLKQFWLVRLEQHTSPVHVLMLESFYNMKMASLTHEADEEIRKFDAKTRSAAHQTPMCEETTKKQLTKLLNTITAKTKMFKSNLRRRSKSVENALAPHTPLRPEQSKHKNYYLLERENLERKYENRIKEIQFEIINSITDLEIQMEQLRRQKDEDEQAVAQSLFTSRQTPRQHQCSCCQHHTNNHKRRKSSEASVLQKRIRSRNRSNNSGNHQQSLNGSMIHKRSLSSSMNDFNASFNQPELVQAYYRNPNANETMV